MKLLNRLFNPEWTIAYRKRGNKLLFEKDGRKETFIPLKNSMRYWCADPFLVEWNGHEYLFFERWDRYKRKGVIAYREEVNGRWGRVVNAIELEGHLSYPFAFVYKNELYIVPESFELNRTVLLKCVDSKPTLKFEIVETIIDHESMVDTTFLDWHGEIYAFTTFTRGPLALSVYRRVENGKWMLAQENAVEGPKCSRMGGAFLKHGGNTLRVSQNCDGGYGRGINFSVVDDCGDTYKEHPLTSLFPNDVEIKDVQCADGIHTYNADEKYEVIDFVFDKKIRLYDVMGRLAKRFKKH